MGKRMYALERGGPKELVLRWRWRLRDFEVAVRGASWKIDRATLERGADLVLPDGSSLRVRHVKPPWWTVGRRSELHVDRNGVPVLGSDGHPRVIARGAGRVILFFALLRVVFLGLWFTFQRPGAGPVLASPALALLWLGMLAAGVLALFGLRLPVLAGAVLFSLELLLYFARGAATSPVGLVVQVAVIAHLVSAWRRMKPRQHTPSLASVFE
jgi:hypothetical protein